MITAHLFADAERLLCIGAHPDDIEIGCGGTLLQMRRRFPMLDIRWLILSGNSERRSEAVRSAERMLGDAGRLTLHEFRDGFLPLDDAPQVKAILAAHAEGFTPDVVFAPRRSDAHQDHRLLGRLAWQVYRTQPVLHYELPKYEGDLAGANAYVVLEEDDVTAKVEHLLTSFPSEAGKPWFDEDVFRGLMRLRGVECRAPSGYAEAFEAPKLRLG
ncbi:MAG TPA: PIG-L deacetylase family protein [Acidimicrobiia bacterium]|nr:PIG-L deacetylase family protein [Acidimicrobiia bacterium]